MSVLGVQHRESEDLIFAINDPTDNDHDDDEFREDRSVDQPDDAAGERDGSSRDSSSDTGTARTVYNAGNDFAGQNTDSGGEDSVYHSASERSAPPSDDEHDEQPPSDLQHAIDKLFAFPKSDVGARTDDQHDKRRRQHVATVAANDHHGLNDILQSRSASSDMLTPDPIARLRNCSLRFVALLPSIPIPGMCVYTRKRPRNNRFDRPLILISILG